jgi:starch synthase (maltosyl-transferring)
VTVWEDLAEVDNERAYARDALWAFWSSQVRRGLELGFHGFRCDAAYKVPAELWRYLIGEARSVRPDVQFFAETLGAPLDAVLALRDAGFDYIFNSSKWWNFSEWWALEQHARFCHVAPSVAFPESHDTGRVATESGGSEAVQRQRYAFAAAFSAGVMTTTGYEFGFRRQVSVLHTMPSDWERRRMDLRGFVKRVNALKLRHPAAWGGGALRAPGAGGECACAAASNRRSGSLGPGQQAPGCGAGDHAHRS